VCECVKIVNLLQVYHFKYQSIYIFAIMPAYYTTGVIKKETGKQFVTCHLFQISIYN